MSFDPWTLGLQTINVVVLFWLLGRFFWRPVAKMIGDRRTAIDQSLADAESKRQAADAALAEIASTRAGFAAEHDAMLAKAQQDAEAARGAILDKAAADSRAAAAAAQDALKAERAQAESAWRAEAANLAVDIAQKLLAPLGTDEVQRAFADRLIGAVAVLPETEKQALGSSQGAIEAVAATPISAEDTDRLRQRLGGALNADIQLDVRVDPSLIAGIDLVAPHLVIHNNWRADLDQVQAEFDRAHG